MHLQNRRFPVRSRRLRWSSRPGLSLPQCSTTIRSRKLEEFQETQLPQWWKPLKEQLKLVVGLGTILLMNLMEVWNTHPVLSKLMVELFRDLIALGSGSYYRLMRKRRIARSQAWLTQSNPQQEETMAHRCSFLVLRSIDIVFCWEVALHWRSLCASKCGTACCCCWSCCGRRWDKIRSKAQEERSRDHHKGGREVSECRSNLEQRDFLFSWRIIELPCVDEGELHCYKASGTDLAYAARLHSCACKKRRSHRQPQHSRKGKETSCFFLAYFFLWNVWCFCSACRSKVLFWVTRSSK